MKVVRQGAYWQGRFKAMASPCEILVEVQQETEARLLCEAAEAEARRIEQKFSRYRDDNIVFRINQGGDDIRVDDETARLLDYAQHCYEISEGWFDITSGVLRRAWQFKPGARIPRQREIDRTRTSSKSDTARAEGRVAGTRSSPTIRATSSTRSASRSIS